MSRVFIGQFKGAKGETGDRGIKGDKGEKGDKGDRGSRITRGTAITGTSTNGTKFPNSGISDAKNHDYYINENTGNLYECIVPGNADTAEWAHAGSFKGPKGDTGPAGSISNINEQKPTYTEAAVLTNISSGETVKIAFGKLKKALSVLMTHYVQQATASVLGHVKLSNSAAVTQTGQMALDAVEKNASVAGTLANQISQVNSNLMNKADTSMTFCIRGQGITNDINTWFDNGIYNTSPETINNNFSYAICIVFTVINWHYQFVLTMYDSDKILFRRGNDRNATNWSDWKYVSTQS